MQANRYMSISRIRSIICSYSCITINKGPSIRTQGVNFIIQTLKHSKYPSDREKRATERMYDFANHHLDI